MSSAVPATTWFTARLTISSARIALTARPAAIPAASPRAVDPEKYAAESAKNAPESIAPSMPILMMPLSSTISSPIAASRMGVAMLIVELRNASSIGWRSGRRSHRRRGRGDSAAQPREDSRIEGEQDHDDQCLDHLNEHR